MRRIYIWLIAIVTCMLSLLGFVAMNFSISAQPTPGRFETWLANRVKSWAIRQASARAHQPLPPAHIAAAVSRGRGLFNMECAFCHGHNGQKTSAIGYSMYPRVLTLDSPQVQNLSNREMYWVIENGIRLSGMPGFAKINNQSEIWELVLYAHSLGHTNQSMPIKK